MADARRRHGAFGSVENAALAQQRRNRRLAFAVRMVSSDRATLPFVRADTLVGLCRARPFLRSYLVASARPGVIAQRAGSNSVGINQSTLAGSRAKDGAVLRQAFGNRRPRADVDIVDSTVVPLDTVAVLKML